MPSNPCHIDIESFSEADLMRVGAYRYAEDHSTEILCVMYAFADGPVNLWMPFDREEIPIELRQRLYALVKERARQSGHVVPGMVTVRKRCPLPLHWHASHGGLFEAFNANFERVMLNGSPGKRIRFPRTKLAQWHCVMVQAKEHGLPAKLGTCAKALKTPHQKDEDGRGDMMRLSKPRKPSKHNPATRWLPADVPDKFFNLYSYCLDDVETERDISNAVPPISKSERKVYLLDQKINDRGWMIDERSIYNVQHLITEYKEHIAEKMVRLCGLKPTQREKLADWIREQGVDIPNLQAQTVVDYLKKKDQPEEVRWALRMYSLYNMKATAKYDAMQRAVCSDGALRGMFNFYGASTGRWSSWIVQLQNLFRPVIDDPEFAIFLFGERDIDEIKFNFDKNPMKVFSSCVRGMLVPREGMDLMFADFSSIEARIVAWMADAKEKLEIFRTHGLVYEHTASKIWGHPLDLESLKTFKKREPELRFYGKISELALGYQGGQAAFVKMAKQFGADIDEELADKIKWDWRAANPEVVAMWDNINDAAIRAVLHPRTIVKVHKLAFRYGGKYLEMRLPSGRKLRYYKPFVKNDELRYRGIDTYTRQWQVCKTYGGKLVQNAAEGIARDLLTAGMLRLHRTKRYALLGTVHDELITEVKEGKCSVEECENLMAEEQPWARGLPVRAVGERTKRYKK